MKLLLSTFSILLMINPGFSQFTVENTEIEEDHTVTVLKKAIIKKVDFDQATFPKVFSFLTKQVSKHKDLNGVLLITKLPRLKDKDTISLSLRNISMFDLIRYVCLQGDYHYFIKNRLISISKSVNFQMDTRFYAIPLQSISPRSSDDHQKIIEELLVSKAGELPESSQITYDKRIKKLIIHTTVKHFEKIEPVIRRYYGAGLRTRTANKTFANAHQLKQKCKTILFGELFFKETNVKAVLDFMQESSRQSDPQKAGINVLFAMTDREINTIDKITIAANQITFYDALEAVCQTANLNYCFDNQTIIIKKREENLIAAGNSKTSEVSIVEDLNRLLLQND